MTEHYRGMLEDCIRSNMNIIYLTSHLILDALNMEPSAFTKEYVHTCIETMSMALVDINNTSNRILYRNDKNEHDTEQ